jgi:hypothetical protein
MRMHAQIHNYAEQGKASEIEREREREGRKEGKKERKKERK